MIFNQHVMRTSLLMYNVKFAFLYTLLLCMIECTRALQVYICIALRLGVGGIESNDFNLVPRTSAQRLRFPSVGSKIHTSDTVRV